MKLMTKELEKKFERYPLYSQDGMGGKAKVLVKYFNPVGAGTWLITEGNKLENGDYEMFGYCHLGDDDFAELGYVMLSDLERGHYRVAFSIDTAEENHGKCEVAMGGKLLAEKEIAGSKEIELEFDVEGTEEGIEFRVQTEGGSLRCDSVHLWKQK